MTKFDRIVMFLVLTAALALTGGSVTRAEGEGDWVDLFTGDDFTGWAFHLTKEGKDNEGTFALEEGIMSCAGRPSGYMYSEKTYSSFILELEWAFDRPERLKDDFKFRGNSGVLIHVGEKNSLNVWPRSIEVQGKYTQAGLILPIPRKVKCKRTFNKKILPEILKPVGEWNAMRIEVDGGEMVISINGTEVSTVSDCELTQGPLAIQSEGAATRWRNVRILER